MDLRNVIARGTAADVQTTVVTGGTGTINLAYSNYTTASNSINGTSNITPVGSPTNQTASPAFVNAPGGDYHEATGSPTIDAGAADARTGTLDLDGEARSQGTSMDIGADEFTVAAPPPPPDTTPPETTIDKGPAKKTKSRKATFKFSSNEAGSSFECKVDSKPAKPCTSPLKLKRVKPGKHKLAVAATDAAGNTDATPAIYKWKVKKKH
jgi:hypothetical protein